MRQGAALGRLQLTLLSHLGIPLTLNFVSQGRQPDGEDRMDRSGLTRPRRVDVAAGQRGESAVVGRRVAHRRKAKVVLSGERKGCPSDDFRTHASSHEIHSAAHTAAHQCDTVTGVVRRAGPSGQPGEPARSGCELLQRQLHIVNSPRVDVSTNFARSTSTTIPGLPYRRPIDTHRPEPAANPRDQALTVRIQAPCVAVSACVAHEVRPAEARAWCCSGARIRPLREDSTVRTGRFLTERSILRNRRGGRGG